MWWIWTIEILAFIFLLGYLFRKYMQGDPSYWPKRGVYCLDLNRVSTALERWTFKIPFHELDLKIYKEFKSLGKQKYGGLIELRKPIFYVMDLDLIKHIMVKDFDSFVNRRQTVDLSKTDPMMSKMLLSTKDQEWKDLRATVSPTFTTGKIRRMFQIFQTSSEKMVNFLHEKLKITPENNEVEIREIFTRFTMDVISSTAFGLDCKSFGSSESEFCKMAKRVQKLAFSQIVKFAIVMICPKIFSILKIPLGEQVSTKFFAKVTQEAIEHRKKTGEIRDDFLQLLIEAKEEKLQLEDDAEIVHNEVEQEQANILINKKSPGKLKLTDTHILSQSILFFFAGFDTVETLLLFTAYELAVNQEVQDQLYRELKNAHESNNNSFSHELINKLEYLDKVISETLRKYPPAFRTERVASKPYKIPDSDVILDKDTIVAVPLYSIHHDPEYYPNPEKFDPERFSPEEKSKRNPYSYMPFGVGPRNCIAMRFALVEAKCAVANLILRSKLEPTARTPIPMKMSNKTGFKPEGGVLWLKVKPR